ncbi:MAG: helix-turn-helix domain-containing protein, partial [Akkermansiaceae bacterium]
PMLNTQHIQTRRDAAEASNSVPLLTIPQAAAFLNIGKRTLQSLAAERKLAQIKIGRCTRFDHSDLLAFIEGQKNKALGWKGGKSA